MTSTDYFYLINIFSVSPPLFRITLGQICFAMSAMPWTRGLNGWCLDGSHLMQSLNDNLFNTIFQEIPSHVKRPLNDPSLRVILFVSHRWKHPQYPDGGDEVTENNESLNGSQLKTIRRLIDNVFDGSMSEDRGDKTRPVVDDFDYYDEQNWDNRRTLFDWKNECNGDRDKYYSGIGVWYDNCCIPQGRDERLSEEQKQWRQQALDEMSDIIVFSNVIVLPSEDYLSRAWCMMELAVSFESSICVFIEHNDDFMQKMLHFLRFKSMENEYFKNSDFLVPYQLQRRNEDDFPLVTCTNGSDLWHIYEITVQSVARNSGLYCWFFGLTNLSIVCELIFAIIDLLDDGGPIISFLWYGVVLFFSVLVVVEAALTFFIRKPSPPMHCGRYLRYFIPFIFGGIIGCVIASLVFPDWPWWAILLFYILSGGVCSILLWILGTATANRGMTFLYRDGLFWWISNVALWPMYRMISRDKEIFSISIMFVLLNVFLLFLLWQAWDSWKIKEWWSFVDYLAGSVIVILFIINCIVHFPSEYQKLKKREQNIRDNAALIEKMGTEPEPMTHHAPSHEVHVSSIA